MPRRRRGAGMPLNADINVVSLIDVMMLLMVIFMITAPLMQNGLDVDLPKVDARPVEVRGGLTVTVRNDREVDVDGTRLSLQEFKGVFGGFVSMGKTAQGVTIMSDKDVSVGAFYQVLGVIQGAGIQDVNLATVPEDGN